MKEVHVSFFDIVQALFKRLPLECTLFAILIKTMFGVKEKRKMNWQHAMLYLELMYC